MRLTRGEGWWLARRRMTLRQTEMAALLGISEDRLRRWERDREAAPMPDATVLAPALSPGEWCALTRRRAGWGLAEVARRTGISRMTVWKGEHDRTAGVRDLLQFYASLGQIRAPAATPISIGFFFGAL